MAIFRVCKDKDNPYVMLNKVFLEDVELSWKAKGILSYLLSLPDDWKVYEEEITRHSKDGIKATRSGIKELINKGYIHRQQLRENGKFKGYEYCIYETPTVIPKVENGKQENRKKENAKGHATNNNLTNNKKTNKTPTNKPVRGNKTFNNDSTEYLKANDIDALERKLLGWTQNNDVEV